MQHAENPFIANLVFPYVRIIKRDVPPGRTELREGDYFDVESTRHTRVYRTKPTWQVLKVLKPSTLLFYTWMQYNIGEGLDYIAVDELKVCQELDYSARHMQRAKAELTLHNILAKKGGNEYWINPMYFSSGDRLRLYPTRAVQEYLTKEKGRQKLSFEELG